MKCDCAGLTSVHVELQALFEVKRRYLTRLGR